MIYAVAIVAAAVAAVAGWFATALVAIWLAGLFGMSDFEGGRAMFGFFGAGPIGGLATMVVAAWLVLRVGTGRQPLGAMLARLAAVLAGVVSLAAAAVGVRLWMVDTYTNRLPPALDFELRVAPGVAVPAGEAIDIELHTDRNVGTGLFVGGWETEPSGAHVIAGTVDLAFKTSTRLLLVAFPNQPRRLFRLPLARDPAGNESASAWYRADHWDDPGEPQPRPAPPDDPIELRYRVRVR
jgi:hypothetical protein